MVIQLKLINDANELAIPKEHKQPPSETHCKTKNLSEKKFLRLVEQILAGGVVPFLGAGLSLQSIGPNRKTIAHTQTMTCAVCSELYIDRPGSKCKANNKESHLRCGQKIIRAKEKRPLFSYSLASKSNNFTGRYLFNSKYIHLRPFKRHLRLGVWHVS